MGEIASTAGEAESDFVLQSEIGALELKEIFF